MSDLERMKTEYMRKTKDQARTISALMAQMAGLQAELRSLAEAHLDTSTILTQQEQQLARERQQQQNWKRKFKVRLDVWLVIEGSGFKSTLLT